MNIHKKIEPTNHLKAKGWVIANLLSLNHKIKRVERTGVIKAESPKGEEFYIMVHSLKDNNAWVVGKEGGEPFNLFHAFVRVPWLPANEDETAFRVFIMHVQDVNDALYNWGQTHAPPPPSGFGYSIPHPHENNWDILPQ